MKKIQICVIDEPLNLTELYESHPYAPKEITLLQTEKGRPPWFSHGTLCTGLLLESLYKYGIDKYVSITHISVSASTGKRDYNKIISALKLCSEKSFDIVSMSIGSFECERGKDMAPFLDRMKHTVVVCSAANDFTLVYPAVLPSVIGVKHALMADAPQIGVVEQPADGIELIVNFPLSDYLYKLSNLLGDNFTGSNSVLVPQVCGILASEMVKSQISMTKMDAMSFFKKIGCNSIEPKYMFPQRPTNEGDKDPPIVLLPTKAASDNQLPMALLIQEEFENHGYPCSIISDGFLTSDFCQGWYTLDRSAPKDCIAYYQEVVADSLILLVSDPKLAEGVPVDLTLTEWTDLCTIGKEQVYAFIMDKLG